MSDADDLRALAASMAPRLEAEEGLVRDLGSRIGYGRLMQAAEKIWRERLLEQGYPGGGEITTGPCAAFMVPCPCPESGRDANGHCEWCCGARRVTERVKLAIEREVAAARPGLDERAAVITFVRDLVDKERRGHGLVQSNAATGAVREYAATVLALVADNLEIGAHVGEIEF